MVSVESIQGESKIEVKWIAFVFAYIPTLLPLIPLSIFGECVIVVLCETNSKFSDESERQGMIFSYPRKSCYKHKGTLSDRRWNMELDLSRMGLRPGSVQMLATQQEKTLAGILMHF